MSDLGPSPHCAGVDGARDSWLAVWESDEGLAFDIYPSPRALCNALPSGVIAVDIPLGLTDRGGRAADAEARALLRGRRASSIFSTPVRGILDARTQKEASARHREIDGRGFGAQSFAILPKIRDWNALLIEDVQLRARVHEIHPEVSFALLNGRAGIAARKKSEEGAAERRALLEREFGSPGVTALIQRCKHPKVARDDILDALAALWTARRIAAGIAESFPINASLDSAGLRPVILA